MPLRTTVIGAFPKPEYLKVPDWFQEPFAKDAGQGTRAYTELHSKQSAEEHAELEALTVRAEREVIELQNALGIDVISDGELRRENYIHYFCRSIDGIDFENLTYTVYRNETHHGELPTIRSKLSWRGPLNVAEEWRRAQALSSRAIMKYTLPGPMTMIGTLYDAFYGSENERELAADLAAIINMNIRWLVEAGCRSVQVDEPLFARRPQAALDYGICMLDRCFEGIGADVEKTMHMCCGYPQGLDHADFEKASKEAYFLLAPQLAASSIDAISLEDAHCHVDLALLPLFGSKKLILGAMQVASSRVESVEEIENRLNEVLQHVPPERLIVSPDCGLGFLTPELVRQKLGNMCEAARRCGGTPVASVAS
eukprot:NODE_8594_length_1483_cov_8.415929.p1 GENE.NODE_8594_length_1483_cov_8.415929~~NODE_8594_length_1483_cov_8.415929.p1  ORF type:complete len:369 (+),score=115.43 NODE_8594_length_1483_cov_8.415929:85-1191(+)